MVDWFSVCFDNRMSSVLILWGKEEIRIERSEIISLEWLKSDVEVMDEIVILIK